MTVTQHVFRLKGHAGILECTGRHGRQRMYLATCECGWSDRCSRSGKSIAKDFHTFHLEEAKRAGGAIAESRGRPSPITRRLPLLGETWTLKASGYTYTVDAVDPPYYRQTDAGLVLRCTLDTRVTTVITMLSFLRYYEFTSSPTVVAPKPTATQATCSGATC
jgi:hypothetical protein